MDQDAKELRELVESDKKSVIKFLEAHGLKVANNQIELLFSDGEVDESKLDQLSFMNLWELEFEPSLLRVEFTIERSKELHSNITGILKNLLYKITNRTELEFPGSNLETSSTCPHFQLIKIDKQQGNLIVQLYGAICYCS